MQTMSLVSELQPGDILSGEPVLQVEEIVCSEGSDQAEVLVKTTRGEQKRLILPSRLPIVINVPLKVKED